MDALALLRTQAEFAESLMAQVLPNITPAHGAWRADGSLANTVSATLLHLYHFEDRTVHRQLGRPQLFEAEGWAARIGADPETVWQAERAPDLDPLRLYVASVTAATRAFLDGLDPSVLDGETETPRGKRPTAALLSLFLVTHKHTHLGEVAALLGMQGSKGFPL